MHPRCKRGRDWGMLTHPMTSSHRMNVLRSHSQDVASVHACGFLSQTQAWTLVPCGLRIPVGDNTNGRQS